ncbi:hypothetical protein [Nannocystis punicea]|uniref:DUF58 domain-containing protein n=1 Tax=Nannocystis punicea TaxID=2995304 RepID=A0ABY7HAZ4_9BACT|nr:hypothetical protein [Nannocystis poenicansa]WAS96412.1 hypothetical protein O0S08_09655 [Nannocystis poenicansa]
MPLWLAQLVVSAFVALALHLTISAWRARTSTPRTISLALSIATCVALLMTALDLPLPNLCGSGAPQVRPDELGSELARWSWRLSPCRRLEVVAGPPDLAAPLDLGELTKMAVGAGVVVDVTLERGAQSRAPEIELMVARSSSEASLPVGTPIPGPYTNDVRPRLGDDSAPVCRIDDGAPRPGASLDTLLGTRKDVLGFHRLKCWRSGDDKYATVSAYIDITDAGVVIASSEADGDSTEVDCSLASSAYGDFKHASSKSYGLLLASRISEKCAILPASAASAASMLVLDRPETTESCDLATGLLKRGATVVVAMPGDEFMNHCESSLLVKRVTNKRSVDIAAGKNWPGEPKGVVFDRTPRLTFLLDDTLDKLAPAPTCVVLDDRQAHCGGPREAKPSIEYQQVNAQRLCDSMVGRIFAPDTRCNGPSTAIDSRSDALESVLYLRRNGPRGADDLKLLERSKPGTALAELGAALVANEARTYWENEDVVVFTHIDPKLYDIDPFVERFGSRVHVVPIQDPYGLSLSTLGQPPASVTLPTELTQAPRSRWRVQPGSCGSDPLARCVPPVSDRLVTVPQTEAITIARPHSRFGVMPAQTRAPVRFGWYKSAAATSKTLPPVQLANTTTNSGLAERPLALGATLDRGHLLLLSHSPFDPDDQDPKDIPWRKALEKETLASPSEMQLIEQLYAGTVDLLADMNGPVLSVTPKPNGALWVTMLRGAEVLDTVEFHPPAGAALVAPLVEFDAAGRTFTYALPAAELKRFRECVALQVNSPGKSGSRPIYACPPGEPDATPARWGAALALEQLAHYTGGVFTPAGAQRPATVADSLHTRSLGLGMLSCLFLFAWGRRSVRRLAGLRAYRQLRTLDAIAQRRYDPPEAVVAAAGDWDGRTSTWPRMGAFGGYRPLEPGDRASAMVLHDLVIREQQGTHLLPRVSLRIEEAAPAVLVLVSLGASMRVPERTDSSKALFAGRVAAHVAASTWKIGGEASLYAVGIDGESELVAPVRLSPGHEEIERLLRARLRQRPTRDDAPWPEDLPECGAVVYVSDFQSEDVGRLQAWVTRLEGEGIRVGGVMLYSPIEFTMIEGGRLASSGVWSDRADWDPDDLFAAFNRRRDQIERIFETVTTGGLVVVATTFGQEDIELALDGGRLRQILR